jgi:ABC-type transport system involved in multi-copper enzyme maturation permease subunit
MITIIAGATAREAIRSKAFLILIAIFAVAVLCSRIVGWISATDGNIVTASMVMSLQSVLGVLVAVATGTALVHTEIQQKTLYTILSRPVERWQFVLGKFLGLAGALVAGQAAMATVGLSYLFFTGAEVNRWMLIAASLTGIEVLVMAAVSMAITSLAGPLLAAVISLAVYALGHAVGTLPSLIGHIEPWQQVVAATLASLIPDLSRLAYRDQAVYGLPLPWTTLGMDVLYAAAWITLLVLVTVQVLRRRQL